MKIKYVCPECDHEQELDVTLPTPAQISGPPERCYTAEDGDFDPECCEQCGADFDYDKVMDFVADYLADKHSNEMEDYYEDYDRD